MVKIIMEVLAGQAVQVAAEPGANQIMAPLELLILEVVVEAEIMVMLVLQMEEFMELHLVVCLI